jgi:type II secretory pathway predicted ATPase ExeA
MAIQTPATEPRSEAVTELSPIVPAGIRELSWQELQQVIAAADATRDAEFASSALNSDEARKRLAPRHPMLDQAYFIKTDQADNFFQVAFDHAVARKAGLYAIGEHRVGKTKAIQYAVQQLRKYLPFMAVFVYDAETTPHLTKAAWSRHVLKQWRYPIQPKQDAQLVLLRCLATGAALAGGHTCVLFIDEAQKLTIEVLEYLAEIWNELRPTFILVPILVGRPGLLTNLAPMAPPPIKTRFFVKVLEMGGIPSLDALTKYLAAYDGPLKYPEQSDWSYSRFFLRAAFDQGWRLEREAAAFWQQLVTASQADPGKIAKRGFRLAFVTDAIHTFLLDGMPLLLEEPKLASHFGGSAERWLETILSVSEHELII